MSAEIKKVIKKPIATIKGATKEIMKPAGDLNVPNIAIGAIASPIIGFAYGKFFDWVAGMTGMSTSNPTVVKIVKILLPLLPAVIVQKFKVPFGGMIAGGLYGVVFLQIGMEIWNLVKGKIPAIGTTAKSAFKAGKITQPSQVGNGGTIVADAKWAVFK